MITNTTLPLQDLLLISLLPHLAQNPELLGWVLCLMHIRGFATTHPKPLLPPFVGCEPGPSKASAASENGQMFEILNINYSVPRRSVQRFLLQSHTQSRADAKAIPRCLGAPGNSTLNVPRCGDPSALLQDLSHSSSTHVITELFGL